jgi:hypothetical protein
VNAVAELALAIAPTSAFCSDADTFALLTATAYDSGGKKVPGVTLTFSTSAGSVIPTAAMTSTNGTATSRLYPGVRMGPSTINVTVRLQANASISATAVFTCRAPIFLKAEG